MRMLVFLTVALMAMIFTYSFGLSGAVAAVVFLFVLFNGVLDRWAKPLFDYLRS